MTEASIPTVLAVFLKAFAAGGITSKTYVLGGIALLVGSSGF